MSGASAENRGVLGNEIPRRLLRVDSLFNTIGSMGTSINDSKELNPNILEADTIEQKLDKFFQRYQPPNSRPFTFTPENIAEYKKNPATFYAETPKLIMQFFQENSPAQNQEAAMRMIPFVPDEGTKQDFVKMGFTTGLAPIVRMVAINMISEISSPVVQSALIQEAFEKAQTYEECEAVVRTLAKIRVIPTERKRLLGLLEDMFLSKKIRHQEVSKLYGVIHSLNLQKLNDLEHEGMIKSLIRSKIEGRNFSAEASSIVLPGSIETLMETIMANIDEIIKNKKYHELLTDLDTMSFEELSEKWGGNE